MNDLTSASDVETVFIDDCPVFCLENQCEDVKSANEIDAVWSVISQMYTVKPD